MSIAANKFRDIYAARCITVEDAEMARTINNANVLCIAAKTDLAINRTILAAFANTAYTGRKLDELERITQFETTETRRCVRFRPRGTSCSTSFAGPRSGPCSPVR